MSYPKFQIFIFFVRETSPSQLQPREKQLRALGHQQPVEIYTAANDVEEISEPFNRDFIIQPVPKRQAEHAAAVARMANLVQNAFEFVNLFFAIGADAPADITCPRLFVPTQRFIQIHGADTGRAFSPKLDARR